jgi:hypothetical protein
MLTTLPIICIAIVPNPFFPSCPAHVQHRRPGQGKQRTFVESWHWPSAQPAPANVEIFAPPSERRRGHSVLARALVLGEEPETLPLAPPQLLGRRRRVQGLAPLVVLRRLAEGRGLRRLRSAHAGIQGRWTQAQEEPHRGCGSAGETRARSQARTERPGRGQSQCQRLGQARDRACRFRRPVRIRRERGPPEEDAFPPPET